MPNIYTNGRCESSLASLAKVAAKSPGASSIGSHAQGSRAEHTTFLFARVESGTVQYHYYKSGIGRLQCMTGCSGAVSWLVTFLARWL